MTDEIKALNLNSDEEVVKTPESTAIPATTTQATPRPMVTADPKKKLLMILAIVLLGIGSGYGIYSFKSPKTPKKLATEATGEVVAGDTFGVMDEDAFRDTAEGEMASGGIGDEGSHHLIREGGESKYVYLTSSIIDLDQFVGKSVKVWGETFGAQQAGWLMDVGRLEVK